MVVSGKLNNGREMAGKGNHEKMLDKGEK